MVFNVNEAALVCPVPPADRDSGSYSGSMPSPASIPYHNFKNNLVGWLTERQAERLSTQSFRIVRRSRDNQIMRVKDRFEKAACLGHDIVKRPVAQGNAGKCAVEMLPNVGLWCYSLRFR
jgi:hypothetical protein